MNVTDEELKEIEAAALAVMQQGPSSDPIHWRVMLGQSAFVTLTPVVARRLVAAVREARRDASPVPRKDPTP